MYANFSLVTQSSRAKLILENATAREKGEIGDIEKYLKVEMSSLGRYSKTINLTKMSDQDFFQTI